eukprot:2933720-Amphidinium_carterae.2
MERLGSFAECAAALLTLPLSPTARVSLEAALAREPDLLLPELTKRFTAKEAQSIFLASLVGYNVESTSKTEGRVRSLVRER